MTKKAEVTNRLFNVPLYTKENTKMGWGPVPKPRLQRHNGNSFAVKYLTNLGKVVLNAIARFFQGKRQPSYKSWNKQGIRLKFDLNEFDEATVMVYADYIMEYFGVELVRTVKTEGTYVLHPDGKGGMTKNPRVWDFRNCKRVKCTYLSLYLK